MKQGRLRLLSAVLLIFLGACATQNDKILSSIKDDDENRFEDLVRDSKCDPVYITHTMIPDSKYGPALFLTKLSQEKPQWLGWALPYCFSQYHNEINTFFGLPLLVDAVKTRNTVLMHAIVGPRIGKINMYGADGMTALDEAIITNAPQSYIDYLKSNGAVTRFRDSTQRLATYQQKTQEMQAAQDESDRQVMEIIGTPEQQQAQTIAMINQTGDSIAGAAAARRTPWVPPSSNPQPSVSYPSQSQFQSSASSANSAPSVASAPNPAETIQIHPEALATECIKTSQRGTELIETNNCSKSVWIGWCTLTGTYACKAQAAPALSPTGYVYQEAQSIVKIEPHMSLGLPETPPGSELFIAACYDPYSSVYITGFSTKQITRGSKFTVSCHF